MRDHLLCLISGACRAAFYFWNVSLCCRMVTVSEASIALSVLRLLEHRNTLIEGGGATVRNES